MKTIALVVFAGVQLLDVAGPLDVFAEANTLVAPGQGYRIHTVGESTQPVPASNGVAVAADLAFADAPGHYDYVLVAGGPQLPQQRPSAALLAWLRQAAAQAGCYGSICTGAFALGHAQLLDGRPVATHWRHVEALARQFPRAVVEPDRIYVRDGALITSAGITAGIDLALALVAEDCGAAVARLVAKRLLVFVQRQGGQSQFSPYLLPPSAHEPLVARVLAYVQQHISEPLSVERLAEAVAMSPRNFARVFAREAQVPPSDFVQRARVDAARQLLEGSALALKAVAYNCGFGSAARMRLVFVRALGLTPSDYRSRFQQVNDAEPGLKKKLL